MAWGIKFDSGRLEFDTAVFYHQNKTNYVAEFEYIISNSATSSVYLVSQSANFNNYISHQSSGSFRVRYDGTTLEWLGVGYVNDGSTVNKAVIVRTGDAHELFFNNISQGVVNSSLTSTVKLELIGGASVAANSEFTLITHKLWSNSTATGDPLFDMNPDASSHTTGDPVLLNIGTSAIDATGIGMPTDGSVWVNLGGGSTSIPVIMNSYRQRRIN